MFITVASLKQWNIPKKVQAAAFLTKFPCGASEIAEQIKQNEINDQKQINEFDQKSNEFKLIYFLEIFYLTEFSEIPKISKDFGRYGIIDYGLDPWSSSYREG